MQSNIDESDRAETIVAALIYLMTNYTRTGCPRVAVCIARHMQCLAVHPEAPPLVRDICAGLHTVWADAASGRATDQRALAH